MGTTAQKLQRLADTKTAIRQAIEAKGVPVAHTDTFADYPGKIGQITSSAPARQPGQHTVRFISPLPDAAGNPFIAVAYTDPGGSVPLPPMPDLTAEGLTAQGWSHTAAQLTNIRGDIDVGALYKPTDGLTHAFITLTPASGLSPQFYFGNNGPMTIRFHWGDGTSTDYTYSNSSLRNVLHTYAGYGDYEIKLEVVSAAGTYILGYSGVNFVYGSTYDATLTKLYVGGKSTEIACIYRSHGLYSIVIPEGVVLKSGAALNVLGVKSIVFPPDSTYPQIANLSYCDQMVAVVLPAGMTEAADSLFHSCHVLSRVIIPEGVTSIRQQAFYNCENLHDLVIPASVASLGENCIGVPYGQTTVEFKRATPPSITSDSIWVRALTRIYVPDASLGAYKTATNWAALAAHIYPVSQKPA